ncbi:spore coat-associated protein N [Alkalibacillus flavidus]|uniref:Spore coat-associated protein N n=1 Tax=Alkalibacillus flavidus TaxID=546021 RepID=A0ABV2KX80_9BACI
MGFKSKLGVGVMSGVLGLSLIGGGTYAAFNDVEEVSNTFAAGTLDLEVGEDSTFEFDISNLKPGDYVEKELILDNNGSLDINQIFTSVSADEWEDKDVLDLNSEVSAGAGDNELIDFLSQFQLTVSGGNGLSATATLDQAVNHTGNSPFDITTTDDGEIGLATGDSLSYDVKIKFVEDNTTFTDSRYHVQNKYQGEGATLNFDFEATQMPGEDRSNDEVGEE